jgi:PPP family 3-phenylpropionic acid transporter
MGGLLDLNMVGGGDWQMAHASMRIITDTVPRALAATAQAVYGLVGVGGATAVLMLLSGWLYARFGPAGFWAMGAHSITVDARELHGRRYGTSTMFRSTSVS